MALACSLIKRMRLDLTASAEEDMTVLDDEETQQGNIDTSRYWVAHPKTLRLTTRPRPPRNLDGSRPRMFNRISKSCSMPSQVFSLSRDVEVIATTLINDSLLPLFRQLHPEKSGWDLSLVNLCATNMAMTGTGSKDGVGRDIGRMFKRQDNILREWKVVDEDVAPPHLFQGLDEQSSVEVASHQRPDYLKNIPSNGSEDVYQGTQESSAADDDAWNSETEMDAFGEACTVCGAMMPSFAMAAHQRFHTLPD